MYSIRQIQLEKVAKMRKKHQPALDDYAKLEEDLLIVTDLNVNRIKSKLAQILTEESEGKEKFLPDDIYLRVGSLSPFGKEKGKEVEEHYQEVLDKMEKYKEQFYEPKKMKMIAYFLSISRFGCLRFFVARL